MSEPFLGEIRMFAGNFAPRGWAFCDGQLLAVSENDALFSLFGTIYGGDGRTTFGLPDLRGRFPVHQGTGPGLSQRRLGVKAGTETETITLTHLPSHAHTVAGHSGPGQSSALAGNTFATSASGDWQYSNQSQDAVLDSKTIANTGGSASHTNVPPFLCINFIVALLGIYPSRN